MTPAGLLRPNDYDYLADVWLKLAARHRERGQAEKAREAEVRAEECRGLGAKVTNEKAR